MTPNWLILLKLGLVAGGMVMVLAGAGVAVWLLLRRDTRGAARFAGGLRASRGCTHDVGSQRARRDLLLPYLKWL